MRSQCVWICIGAVGLNKSAGTDADMHGHHFVTAAFSCRLRHASDLLNVTPIAAVHDPYAVAAVTAVMCAL